MTTKPEGGGVKGLSGPTTKKKHFFADSLREMFILRYRWHIDPDF